MFPAPATPPDLASSPLALLAHESRVRRGPVPRRLGGVDVADDFSLLHGDSFVVRSAAGFALLYRRGEGVTLEQGDDADPRDVALALDGSVYAAIAALNGLLPLHASAVAHGGRVFAFTGAPGAGKSTLAAALGHEGLPLFCDDTLIVDLSGSGALTCLPGHKRLKLWPNGAALAQVDAHEQVASDYLKYFAQSAGGTVGEPLPLAEMIFLEEGPLPALHFIGPGERIARLQDDHYTAMLFEQAQGLPRGARFAQLARIAGRMPMRRFARPFSADGFAQGVRFLARHITEAT